MSEPIEAVLGRLGYVRWDAAGQEVAVPTESAAGSEVEPPAYPQVVMIQGHSAGESWIRDHAGQLLLAGMAGVFALSALTLVALVAVVVAIAAVAIVVGMVTCTAALAIAKSAVSQSARGGRR